MAIPPPPPLEHENPFLMVLSDLRKQRSPEVPYPPGDTDFSIARTRRFAEDPLPILLDAYERHGPVFSLRVFHGLVVFMLGPAANHYITVSHAQNFIWRESHFRDLTVLIGDGLLTTDGEFHRRSRLIMLPAFHRERIASAIGVMQEETERALQDFEVGQQIDLYFWTRRLALRIAMRALFGLDPDGERSRAIDAAGLFEEALAFYSTPYPARMLRGPRTPWSRLINASRRLNRMIYAEIKERRESGRRGQDIMSLLLDATDEHEAVLSNSQIRDEVMTLLFAGHDTTTSTIAFLFHELARNPDASAGLLAEQDEVLGGAAAQASHLNGESLPQLEMAIEETLRMYPPAWIGPRRSVASFEFEGVPVPAEAYVNYSSWASHHLPDVFPEPERFLPLRFAPAAKALLPKGAYIPFGGGSRTCIGMRFGQLEIRTIATAILNRHRLELPADFKLSIRQMPTISPREGLSMIVRERASRPQPLSAAAPAA
jgi:cytochrome P450